MAIDYNKWNKDFGGEEAKKALYEAEQNNQEFQELPDGDYLCKLEKLELAESQSGKPMIKGQFRILEGEYKKQCLFYNQVFCRSANGNGFSMHKCLEFLRSLKVFDDSEVDFDGDYKAFADLLLDIAEESEGMKFWIEKSKNGEYTQLKVTDVND